MKNIEFIIMFVVILLVLCFPYKSHSATFQQAKQVWVEIQNVSGYHLPLSYDPDPQSNAYAGSHSVYITQGMLNDCQTNNQLAMVLGHEMGHYAAQHYRGQTQAKLAELQADSIGYFYCTQAGYRRCLSFIIRMRNLYGEEGNDGIHPTWSERLKNLQRSK